MSHHRNLSFAPVALLFAVSTSACHVDVDVKDSMSATDEHDLFGETEPATATDGLPTTSGGPGDGPVNPQDFCELHPGPMFPGELFSCSGVLSSTLVFDYYGASDIPVNSLFPCLDMSGQAEKEPGYLYTCFISIPDQAFGPEAEQADGRDVEACCLGDSPDSAVDPFCRIDAAQDMCVAVSDQLNALRKELKLVPNAKELKAQLENFNYFLAAGETQSDCAATFAKGFLDTGDIDEPGEAMSWHPASKAELDPEEGWPWFRDIDLRVTEFVLEDVHGTGAACMDAGLGEPLAGTFEGGNVQVLDGEGHATTSLTGGSFTLRQARCELDTCKFELSALQLAAGPVTLGGMLVSEVTAELAAPALGTVSRGVVRIPGNRLELMVAFKIASPGTGPGDGEVQAVRVRAHGEVSARLGADQRFSLQSLRFVDGPLEIELTTLPGQDSR